MSKDNSSHIKGHVIGGGIMWGLLDMLVISLQLKLTLISVKTAQLLMSLNNHLNTSYKEKDFAFMIFQACWEPEVRLLDTLFHKQD